MGVFLGIKRAAKECTGGNSEHMSVRAFSCCVMCLGIGEILDLIAPVTLTIDMVTCCRIWKPEEKSTCEEAVWTVVEILDIPGVCLME